MQKIEIFINELSWHGQYEQDENKEKLLKEIENFRAILTILMANYNKSVSVFFAPEGLKQFLEEASILLENERKDVIKQIKQRTQKLIDWQIKQAHSTENAYFYLDYSESFRSPKLEPIDNKSLAEIAERKLQRNENHTFLIFNFGNSKFSYAEFISILKTSHNNPPQVVHLEQIEKFADLKMWLRIHMDWQNAIDDKDVFEKIKEYYKNSMLQNFDWQAWKPSEKYLPFKDISNQLVDNDWNSFSKELRKNAKNKISLISKMAKQVAIINGYDFNKEVSDLNKSQNKIREIYSAGNGNHCIYLSVDFETGGFEVCDYSGTWLGEYGFGGNITQNPDTMDTKTRERKIKEHSIKVKN